MDKLKWFNTVNSDVKNKVVNSIQINCRPLVDLYLKNILATQVDAGGQRFPEKKESTKRQYRYKGYNTEQWLIRTGQATQVKYRNIPSGFEARPEDPDDILQYVKRAEDWFTLNESIRKEILEQIKTDLKR